MHENVMLRNSKCFLLLLDLYNRAGRNTGQCFRRKLRFRISHLWSLPQRQQELAGHCLMVKSEPTEPQERGRVSLPRSATCELSWHN